MSQVKQAKQETNAHHVSAEEQSVSTLVLRAVTDTSDLVASEIKLAKLELQQSVSETRDGLMNVARGALVAFSGFLVLLAAATFGLSNWVEPWLAALIIGGVTLVIGFIMISSGKKKTAVESYTPQKTTEAMRKDRDMIKGALS